MKRILIILMFVCFSFSLFAQGNWQVKDNVSTGGNKRVIEFVLNDTRYHKVMEMYPGVNTSLKDRTITIRYDDGKITAFFEWQSDTLLFVNNPSEGYHDERIRVKFDNNDAKDIDCSYDREKKFTKHGLVLNEKNSLAFIAELRKSKKVEITPYGYNRPNTLSILEYDTEGFEQVIKPYLNILKLK